MNQIYAQGPWAFANKDTKAKCSTKASTFLLFEAICNMQIASMLAVSCGFLPILLVGIQCNWAIKGSRVQHTTKKMSSGHEPISIGKPKRTTKNTRSPFYNSVPPGPSNKPWVCVKLTGHLRWFCYKFFQWVPGTHLGESCGSQAKFYESSVGVPTIILTKQKISINNYCTTTGIQICKSLYWDNVYICLDFDNYMAFWKGNWYHTAYLSSYSQF